MAISFHRFLKHATQLRPITRAILSSGLPDGHIAFPNSGVYLKGFEDNIAVLSSMIRPKKLTCLGSDGKLYPFLCKPKDDLRKDGRLTEFNGIINKLLRRDTISRRMQLHIKTYVSSLQTVLLAYIFS